MKRLKQRWNIESNIQLVLILLTFSITGSLSLVVVRPMLSYFGLVQGEVNPWVFWSIRILLVFIAYQIMLVIIGTILGQFKFFWAFEKKMLSRLGLGKLLKN